MSTSGSPASNSRPRYTLAAWRNRVLRVAISLAILCLPCTACDGTSPKPSLLTANVVNPQDVNAVSDFGSCSGHPYPETNSPTSGKNYFWPNSSNFDIAVSEKNDTATEDYFARLDGPTFAAWRARGLTTVSQTISRATGVYASFMSNPGNPDIFSLVPSL